MGSSIPVRRGSLTITDCDRELAIIAESLGSYPKPSLPNSALADLREQLHLDADRWLDTRIELAAERARIKAQGNVGL